MADGNLANLAQAREAAYATPLEQLNPAQPELFQADAMWPIFERLRAEDPVHYTAEHEFGPYWSITKYNDIMAVDTNHDVFSSSDGIVLSTLESIIENEKIRGPRDRNAGGFISMDPPHHGPKRKSVTPAVAPDNLARMAPQVRERAGLILDSLPIGEEFDWVDKVSKEHLDIPFYTTPFVWVMNKGAYDGMSANQKKVIDSHCTPEWAEKVDGPWADFEHAGIAKIKAEAGHEVYGLAPDQVAAWKKAAAPLQSAWADGVRKTGGDPDAVMKELTAALAKYNAAAK